MRPHIALTALGLAALFALSGLLVAPTARAQDNFGSNYQAEYYASPDLSGGPVLTRTEPRLDLNFGSGSPGEGVPADNFSARFTTNQNFAPGAYEFVAQADDGVRVEVGGALIIDQLNAPPGTYTGQLIVEQGGDRQIRVEYREASGNASLRFFWRPAGPAPTPTLVPVPPGALLGTVVQASSLVIRDAPFLGANRVTSVRRGTQFAVIGRDPDARWYLVDAGGVQGWTWGFYVFVDGNEFSVPIAPPFTTRGAPASTTALAVQTTAVLKLRAEPNTSSAQIGRVGWGDKLPVIGRSERGSWYQVEFKNTVGWVFSPFTEVIQGDVNSVPFVPGSGALVQIIPTPAPATGGGSASGPQDTSPANAPTPISIEGQS